MAELALAPVHPLPTAKKDRTAAERQRRHRNKQKTVTGGRCAPCYVSGARNGACHARHGVTRHGRR